MFLSRLFRYCLLLILCTSATPAMARDWFVSAGGTGDGTKEKPFGDPFEALEKAEANDVIHIAEGKYMGKLQGGAWSIPFEGIQLMGGYSTDWSQRDPWKFKTQLAWDRNSKNKPTGARIEAKERGVVLDGLVLDGVEQNEYDDTGRTPKSLDTSEELVRLWLPSTVRNCIFINTTRQAIVCPNGTTIENNLFMNTFDSAVKINGLPAANAEAKTPAIVKNNTFLWSWDDRAPGKGRYSGAGIYMTGPATITGNIFAHCDNNAIYSTIPGDRTTVSNNVFFMNLWANYKATVDGTDAVVDDKTMDLMEEVGLKGFAGNTVANPGMALDATWMERTTKRTAGEPGKLVMDDWNKLRQAMGMDLIGTGGKAASGIAPAYALEKAAALMLPKNAAIKAGARILKLEPKFSGGAVAGVTKTYQKMDIATWASNPDSVDGKDLEMTVAISSVANIGGIPDTFKPTDYEGIFLHDSMGQVRVTGFYKKGSSANRTVNEGAGFYNGSGKASKLYTVKGTAYVVKSVPKAGFLIDSIVPLDLSSVVRDRAKGRDWFVRAGATGGDGSKEKPFRDPYQALEKVEAGDTIHVTGGEYVGKLRAGQWKVDCKDIAMLGGYDKEFATRDPWKNPTLLYCPEDYKGSRGGYTLQGDGDHSGFILDGFIFDKKFNNKYNADGDLLPGESDHSPHLWLARPGCVVRNCLFINGAEGAVRMTASQTIENCIFFNHYSWAVKIEKGFTPEVPLIFRNNTVAFAWEVRFGTGHGITADLLMLEGGVAAVIDNNIFEFADQHAIRLNSDPKDVELTNNVFAHNLFAEVYRATDSQFVDNKNFADLRQLGFKKIEGNKLATPGLPLDQKWFDVYLKRTAYTPGKVEMDDWNKLREILGEPVLATGGNAGTGRAPAYDRNLALTLVPKNKDVTAGARPQPLTVKLEGITRTEEQHDYADTTWEVAANSGEWAKLDGKRVALKIAVGRTDNTWNLTDAPKEKFAAFMVGGPEGSNSPGLPMRVYAPLGTRIERTFNNAKAYTSNTVEETYIIKGIARENRQMVVEAIERAD